MADEATTSAAAPVTFRFNHLVRLRGFNHIALDGKLVRIESNIIEETGKFGVIFLDDRARPPVPVFPHKLMWIAPVNLLHACEFCLVAASSTVDGGRLQMCGQCKTARYCNAECQRADWARHKQPDCLQFCYDRGKDMFPLQRACKFGDVDEVRRLVEEDGEDVNAPRGRPPSS